MRSALTSILIALALLGCQKGDERKKGERDSEASPPGTTTAAPATPRAPGARPAAIGAAEMATIEAMAQFIGGLRDAVASTKGDCDRMAAALAPVMERGKPILEKARALEEKMSGDEATQRWVQDYVEKKTGGLEVVAKGVEGCSEHEGVQSALAGFLQ
ncbi:MAG TPA: hypothetical protein VIG06_11490 [Kofleriaceae bacterium]|jgi:hypothetical protein